MDHLRPAGVNLSANRANYISNPKTHEDPGGPVDKVEVGSQPGRVHKVFRKIGKVMGATIGALYGGARGVTGVNVGFTDVDDIKVIGARKTGSIMGMVSSAVAGVYLMGPVGLAVGAVAGGIIGAGLGQAAPNFTRGLLASAVGASRGIGKGLKKGAARGEQIVDRLAEKLSGNTTQP